ncbi:MAG: acylphosphatase [Thermoplasmatales archaeon]|nr:acylphosphatase [Thermoplasmatales archaeon]
MQRATITITGDVQGAGYRAHIMKTARNAKLVGYAENMLDGTVKVVCEGEKNLIENFVSAIKIKTEIVEVEDIKVEYSDATGKFDGKGFDIQVEESFKGMIRELFQGYVTSEKYFNKGFEKQDKMLEKQDKMQSTMENMHQEIKGTHHELKGFREDTKTEFQTIKTDYGKISQNMEKAIESINTIAKSVETLAKAIAERK